MILRGVSGARAWNDAVLWEGLTPAAEDHVAQPEHRPRIVEHLDGGSIAQAPWVAYAVHGSMCPCDTSSCAGTPKTMATS